jgi:hypothetical protein
MTSPHCPARAAACNFFSACQGAKSFLLPLAKANTSRTRASNSPSSRVSKARESNFPSSRVSRARASNSPYFKGIQGQRIKLPFFKGIHGQSTKLPLLQGYPEPGHQTSLISRVSQVKLPLFQGYPEAEVQTSLSQGYPKAIRLHLPFFQRSKENSCNVSSKFSLVRRRCRRILYFGATLALNLLAATPGLMLKVRQEILPTKSSLEKHQVLFGFRYLLLLSPLVENGVGVQEPFCKGENLCPFFNG